MRESILEALDKKIKETMPVEATIPVADADAIAAGEKIKEEQKKAFEEAGLGDTELPRMFLNRKIPEEPKPIKDTNLKKAYLSEDLFEEVKEDKLTLDENFYGNISWSALVEDLLDNFDEGTEDIGILRDIEIKPSEEHKDEATLIFNTEDVKFILKLSGDTDSITAVNPETKDAETVNNPLELLTLMEDIVWKYNNEVE